MSTALSAVGEAEWARLRKLLDWSESFWLSVLFVRSPAPTQELRERAVWNRRWVAAPMRVVLARSPTELREEADRTDSWPAAPGLTWVEGLARAGTTDDAQWREAWTALLAAMNHRRDALRRSTGGIVLVVPHALRELVRQVAPDLWSVRGPSVTVDSRWAREDSGAPLTRIQSHDLVVDSAAHARTADDLALTLATRETGRTHAAGVGLVTGHSEELEPDLARRAAALFSDADLDPHRATDLAEDAIAAGHHQLAGAALLAVALAKREVDPGLAHTALERALGLEDLDDSLRLRLQHAAYQEALSVRDLDLGTKSASAQVGIARRLAEQLSTPEAQRDLSVSLNNLGRVAEARGDWEAAGSAYEESLGIRRRLAEQLSTPEAQRGLSLSLNSLGRVAEARGDWEAAGSAYEQSLGIRRRLAEQLSTLEAQRDLSVSLDNLGRVAAHREG